MNSEFVFTCLFRAPFKTDVDEEATSSENRNAWRQVQTSVMVAWAAASDWKHFPELLQLSANSDNSGDVSSNSEVCNICTVMHLCRWSHLILLTANDLNRQTLFWAAGRRRKTRPPPPADHRNYLAY